MYAIVSLDELVGERVRTFTCLKLTICRGANYTRQPASGTTALFHFVYIYIYMYLPLSVIIGVEVHFSKIHLFVQLLELRIFQLKLKTVAIKKVSIRVDL